MENYTHSLHSTNTGKRCYSPTAALHSLNRWDSLKIENGSAQNKYLPQMVLFGSHRCMFLFIFCFFFFFQRGQYLKVRNCANKSAILLFLPENSNDLATLGPVPTWRLLIRAEWWLSSINKCVLSTWPQSPPLGPVLSFSYHLTPIGISAYEACLRYNPH